MTAWTIRSATLVRDMVDPRISKFGPEETVGDVRRRTAMMNNPLHFVMDDKDRMIGISGKKVSPRLYFGIGLSGQIQHMVGVMGAKVIAAASSEEKLALCKELGADEVINYSEESLKDKVKELTGGKGVDVVYDPVGGEFAEPAVRSMAWNGRYLVIGFASGPIPEIPLNLTLLKGCSLVGVFWGRFSGEEPEVNLSNIHELWALFAEGKLNPVVTDVFPLEQYEDAFNCLIERRARGKVILTTQ